MPLKIKIEPIFILLIIITASCGDYVYLICTILASIAHEFAHIFVAYKCGYVLRDIKLNLYGASLSGFEKIDKNDAFIVLLAGPFLNIIMSLIIVSIWWFFQGTYSTTFPFFYANIVLAFFNLLPVYPLDGGRLITCLKPRSKKTKTVLKIFGIVTGTLLFLTYIISMFSDENLNLLLMASFVLIAVFNKSEEDSFEHITSIHTNKSKKCPIEIKKFRVSHELALLKLLKFMKLAYISIFIVVNQDEKVIVTIEEREVVELCIKYGAQAQIKSIFSNIQRTKNSLNFYPGL
ncbi:MAG: site-2 protease family protein [Christensenellaceae bacterium]|jgi:stage IV sporulation protein FB|nr:site-2 protease family protein [Christensenellaceae bacterium]